MSRFQVQSSFQVKHQHPLFVLAGSILEGSLQRGMFARIPVNPSLVLVAQIHEIDFSRTIDHRKQVCLLFRPNPNEMELWRGLKLGNEIVEVTTDDSH